MPAKLHRVLQLTHCTYRFRSFKSERRKSTAAGFVDGDFVERFADLSEETMQRVLAGTNEHERLELSVLEVLKTVEEAARLH